MSDALASGCEEVTPDAARSQMITLMVAYVEAVGGKGVRARIEGYDPPLLLSGTLENARPDITYRQNDKAGTVTIIEVVPVVSARNYVNRWNLLSSAAKLYNAELHFVVPGDTKVDLANLLRNKLHAMEVSFRRVTSV